MNIAKLPASSRRSVAKPAPRTREKTRKVSYSLTPDTTARLAVHAKLSGVTAAAALEQIIRPWLLRYGKGRTAAEFVASAPSDQLAAEVAGDDGHPHVLSVSPDQAA